MKGTYLIWECWEHWKEGENNYHTGEEEALLAGRKGSERAEILGEP